MIDMHVHSVWSDGSYTLGQLLDLAIKARLKNFRFTLTDHDTIAGLADIQPTLNQAREDYYPRIDPNARYVIKTDDCNMTSWPELAPESEPQDVISVPNIDPGIEVSCQHQGICMHLLLYFPQQLLGNKKFQLLLKHNQILHTQRTEQVLQQYKKAGILLTDQETIRKQLKIPAEFVHFSKVYKYHSQVAGISFDQAKEIARSAGISKMQLPVKKLPPATEVIKLASSKKCPLIVLAHPGTLKPIKNESNHQLVVDYLEKFIVSLVTSGLNGMEVYHSKHSLVQENIFFDFASEHKLIITGGSDFHGELTPKVKLGDKGIKEINWLHR